MAAPSTTPNTRIFFFRRWRSTAKTQPSNPPPRTQSLNRRRPHSTIQIDLSRHENTLPIEHDLFYTLEFPNRKNLCGKSGKVPVLGPGQTSTLTFRVHYPATKALLRVGLDRTETLLMQYELPFGLYTQSKTNTRTMKLSLTVLAGLEDTSFFMLVDSSGKFIPFSRVWVDNGSSIVSNESPLLRSSIV